MAEFLYSREALRAKFEQFAREFGQGFTVNINDQQSLSSTLKKLKGILLFSRTFVQEKLEVGVLEHPLIYVDRHEEYDCEFTPDTLPLIQRERIYRINLGISTHRTIYQSGIAIKSGAELIITELDKYIRIIAVLFVKKTHGSDRIPVLVLINKVNRQVLYLVDNITGIGGSIVTPFVAHLDYFAGYNFRALRWKLEGHVPSQFNSPCVYVKTILDCLFYILTSSNFVLICLAAKGVEDSSVGQRRSARLNPGLNAPSPRRSDRIRTQRDPTTE